MNTDDTGHSEDSKEYHDLEASLDACRNDVGRHHEYDSSKGLNEADAYHPDLSRVEFVEINSEEIELYSDGEVDDEDTA